MSKKLIIAEKPSVANDIARALGNFTKEGDYFENDEYVLSSAVGHLLELIVPEQYEVKRGKWSFDNLPVIPPHFDVAPIEKTSARLKLLCKLIKRKDVDTLRSLGADSNLIQKIFMAEGMLISLAGTLTGALLGLLICWLQIRFGFVGLHGSFIIDAYPVVIKMGDIAFILLLVLTIGYIAARFPVRIITNRILREAPNEQVAKL